MACCLGEPQIKLSSAVRRTQNAVQFPEVLRALSSTWLEQGAHNALVGGSNPPGPTITIQANLWFEEKIEVLRKILILTLLIFQFGGCMSYPEVKNRKLVDL